jgi:hypothetical protein
MQSTEESPQLSAIRTSTGEEVTWSVAIEAVWNGDAEPESFELIARWSHLNVELINGSVGPNNRRSIQRRKGRDRS